MTLLVMEEAEAHMVQTVFSLRRFQPDDLEKVMHINQVCLPENYSTYFFMELYERYPETFIVAEVAGEVAGYIMCRIETGLPDFGLLGITKRGHVISVAVLPEYQRKGIGETLIRQAMLAMRQYKAKDCYLEVRVSNTPATVATRNAGRPSDPRSGPLDNPTICVYSHILQQQAMYALVHTPSEPRHRCGRCRPPGQHGP